MKYSLIFVSSAAIAASIGLVQAAPVNLAAPEKFIEDIGSSNIAGLSMADRLKAYKPVEDPNNLPRLRYEDHDLTMTSRINKYRASNVRSDEPLPELKRSHSDPALKHLRAEFKPVKNFGIKDPEDVYFAPVSTKLQRTLSDFGKAEPRTLLTQARQKGLDKVPKGNHWENFPLTVQESKGPNIVESYWHNGRAWKEELTRLESGKFDHLYPDERSFEHADAFEAYTDELRKFPSEVDDEFSDLDVLEATVGLKPKEEAQLRALEQAYPSIAAKRKIYQELEAPYHRLRKVEEAHKSAQRIFNSHSVRINKEVEWEAEKVRHRALAIKDGKRKLSALTSSTSEVSPSKKMKRQ